MVESLAWSPSIVMWVVFNEGWGQHATGLRVRQVRGWLRATILFCERWQLHHMLWVQLS